MCMYQTHTRLLKRDLERNSVSKLAAIGEIEF